MSTIVIDHASVFDCNVSWWLDCDYWRRGARADWFTGTCHEFRGIIHSCISRSSLFDSEETVRHPSLTAFFAANSLAVVLVLRATQTVWGSYLKYFGEWGATQNGLSFLFCRRSLMNGHGDVFGVGYGLQSSVRMNQCP